MNPGFAFHDVSDEGWARGAHIKGVNKRIQAKLGSPGHQFPDLNALVGGFIEPPEGDICIPLWAFVRDDKLHGEMLLGKGIEINKASCPCWRA